MARTKVTARKNMDTDKQKKLKPAKHIHCTKCSTKVSTITALKRHTELKHGLFISKYECQVCLKTYCRMDIAKRHFKQMHPTELLDESAFRTIHHRTPKEAASIPTTWTPPFESTGRKNFDNIKFRIIPANTVPQKSTEQEPICIDTLAEDLYLSDSEDEIINTYSDNLYVNENQNSLNDSFSSVATDVQDELPTILQNRKISVHSVYGIF